MPTIDGEQLARLILVINTIINPSVKSEAFLYMKYELLSSNIHIQCVAKSMLILISRDSFEQQIGNTVIEIMTFFV